MKIKTLLSAVLIIINLMCFSQEDFSLKEIVQEKNKLQGTVENGYVINKNNERKAGFIILGLDSRNSEFIYFQKYRTAPPEMLTKNEILGYGYDDVYYKLMSYKDDSIFMKKLNRKEPFLYYCKINNKKEFYLEKGDKLEMIPSDKDQLMNYLSEEMKDCEESIDNIKKVKYNKTSLTYVFQRDEECSSDRIPTFKFGFHTGYVASKLILNNEVVYKYGTDGYFNLNNINYSFNSGFLIGVFIDYPLGAMEGRLSFHPEVEYAKVNYNFKKNPDIKFGYDIEYYTLNAFFRYKDLDKKKALFLDFGFIFSSMSVSNSYVTSYKLNHQLDDYMVGGGIGAGVSLNNRIDISARTNYIIAQTMPRAWNIQLIVGVEF